MVLLIDRQCLHVAVMILLELNKMYLVLFGFKVSLLAASHSVTFGIFFC